MPATVYSFRAPASEETTQCCSCGVDFTSPVLVERHRDGKSFYCPNGHSQHYTVLEADRLRSELAEANRKLSWANGERDAAQTKLRKLEKRIAKGVCPCCHRSFGNVQQHMKTKHPDFPKAKEK